MKATISLKQLRTDPRSYIRLLTSGYEVAITEHRKTIVRSVQPSSAKSVRTGNIAEVLRVIKSLPPIQTPYPELDTVELIKQTRLEGYEAKRQKIEQQHAGS